MRRRARLLPALLSASLLAGCGAGDEQPAATAPADTTRLTVEVTGAGKPVRIALRCGGARPCERTQLDELAAVAKPADPARACTEQYGGPEKAHMAGTLEGRPVDVTVTRSDGCGIADYEALFAALGRKPPIAR